MENVCGSGKERTISVRPHLLTPKSFTKVYKNEPKIQKTRGKKERTIFRQPLLASLPKLSKFDDGDISPLSGSTSPTSSPSLPRHDSFISELSSVGNDETPLSLGSYSDSELSLVSYDDETCSLVSGTTDRTDATSTFGDNYSVGEYPLTTEWIKTQQQLYSNSSGGTPQDVESNLSDFDNISCISDDPSSIGFQDLNKVNTSFQPTSLLSNSHSEQMIKIATNLKMPVTSVPQSASINDQDSQPNNKTIVSNKQSVMMLSKENDSLRKKVNNLKQSLKLSEADIAILVSSKQQLQLQYHESHEKKRSLTSTCKKQKSEISHLKGNLEKTQNEFKEFKKMNTAFSENKAIEKSSLEEKLLSTMQCLDKVREERDKLQAETKYFDNQVVLYKTKITRLEEEAEVSINKILELEKQLEDGSVSNEGSGDYIAHLKKERSEYVQKLQDKEYEILKLSVSNQHLEDDLKSIKNDRQELKSLLGDNEALLKKLKLEHKDVLNNLDEVKEEKNQLDEAVKRLYTDLSKVGESFSRLKQQMNEKTYIAEKFSSANAEMKEKLTSFSGYIKELEASNANLHLKISDKNVQIGQYLFKNKQLNSTNNKLSKKVEELEKFLNERKTMWQKALEKEKLLERKLVSKEETLQIESKRNVEFEQLLKTSTEATKQYEFQKSKIKDLNSDLEQVKQFNEELKTSNNALSSALRKHEDQLTKKEREISNLNQSKTEEVELAKKDNKILQLEVDKLQKQLLNSLKEIETLKLNSSMEEESKNNTNDVNEMLAELQQSRRSLALDCDKLCLDVESKKKENDILQEHLNSMKTKYSTRIDDLNEKLSELTQDLKHKEQNMEKQKVLFNEELKLSGIQTTKLQTDLALMLDHKEKLANQLFSLHEQKEELKISLDDAKQKLENKSSLYEQATDELKVAKEQLAETTVRLTEVLNMKQTNKCGFSEKEIDEIIKERNLLKDAVAKQQEYVGSLHKHYDKWAKETASQMKVELQRMTSAAEVERNSLSRERDDLLKQVTTLEQKLVFSESTSKPLQRNFGTQTEHDNDPASPFFIDVPQMSSSICLISSASQTSGLSFNSSIFTNNSTQTDHNNVMIMHLQQNDILYTKNIDRFSSVQIQTIEDFSPKIVFDKNSQTEHSMEPLTGSEPVPEYKSISMQTLKVMPNLCDNFCQTDHNNEVARAKCNLYQQQSIVKNVEKVSQTSHELEAARKKDEMFSQILVNQNDCSTQIEFNLTNAGTQTEHKVEEIKLQNSALQSILDVGTQTLHEDELIKSNYSIFITDACKPLNEVICTVSGTQTPGLKIDNVILNCGTQTDVFDYLSKSQEDKNCVIDFKHKHCQTEIGVFHHLTPFQHLSEVPLAIGSRKNRHNSTQTDHDDDFVLKAKDNVYHLTQIPNVRTCSQTSVGSQTDNKTIVLPKNRLVQYFESSSQTIHDDEILGHNNYEKKYLQYQNVSVQSETSFIANNKVSFKDGLTQTETHKDHPTRIKSTQGTQTDHDFDQVHFDKDNNLHDDNIATSDTASQTARNFNAIKQKNNIQLCNKCNSLLNSCSENQEDSISGHETKYVSNANCQTELLRVDTNNLQLQAPTPLTILKAMEGKKLKAFKQTVKILKKKLEASEKYIFELKQKLQSGLLPKVTIGTQTKDVKLNERGNTVMENANVNVQEVIKQLEESLNDSKCAKEEILIAKKSHAVQIDTLKRRNLAERKKMEKKSYELNERLIGLTDSNKELRKSVTLLQVKISEKARLLNAAQKDKQRYQSRARRLQASLRSLSWISGKEVKVNTDSTVNNVEAEFASGDVLQEIQEVVHSNDTNKNSFPKKDHKLPSSVHVIEETLKNLQCEMVALEKQVQDHNIAVRKNNYDWVQLKQTSPKSSVPVVSENRDQISQITDIV